MLQLLGWKLSPVAFYRLGYKIRPDLSSNQSIVTGNEGITNRVKWL